MELKSLTHVTAKERTPMSNLHTFQAPLHSGAAGMLPMRGSYLANLALRFLYTSSQLPMDEGKVPIYVLRFVAALIGAIPTMISTKLSMLAALRLGHFFNGDMQDCEKET